MNKQLAGGHLQTHACDDSTCPCHEWAQRLASDNNEERQQVERQSLFADGGVIRAAVLHVLDAWQGGKDDIADDELNLDFADAVHQRIAQLQRAGFGVRLEQLCDSHKRDRLPDYDGECIQCRAERLTSDQG